MTLLGRRRDNRRKTSARRRGMIVVAVAAAAATAAVLLTWGSLLPGIARAAAGALFESSYFSAAEIQVRGSDRIRGNEIVALAGLQPGVNLWEIDLEAIERKVAKHPWVRRVSVRREFPGRVVIEVEEREPKAIVAIGRLYYVDADGVVFKEVGPEESVSFPMLTGLAREELRGGGPDVRRRIRDALRLSELMTERSRTLSEIHFDAPDRLVVYTTALPLALHVGSGDWEAKLERLDRVLSLWKGNEEKLISLDASFRDQVVARLRRASR